MAVAHYWAVLRCNACECGCGCYKLLGSDVLKCRRVRLAVASAMLQSMRVWVAAAYDEAVLLCSEDECGWLLHTPRQCMQASAGGCCKLLGSAVM